MRTDDLRAFARRDWRAIAASKDEAWLARHRSEGMAGALRTADALRRQARALHPEWPSDAERAEDLETHVRVGEALRRVGSARPR